MIAIRLALAAALLLPLGAGAEAGDLMRRKPMKTWGKWIARLEMPKARDRDELSRPLERMSRAEWRLERVYLLLGRIDASCDDLAFQAHDMQVAAANAVTGGPLWLGASNFPTHRRHGDAVELYGDVDAAFAKHGKALCKGFYRVLGPGGGWVRPFNRLVPSAYTGQVLWRSRDICARPDAYWGPVGAGSEAKTRQRAVGLVCKQARQHAPFWAGR